MKKILKYFPLSLSTKDPKSLAITVAIYVLLPLVFWLISSLFSGVLLLGTVMSIITWIFGAYCFIGIIIAALKVAGVIK